MKLGDVVRKIAVHNWKKYLLFCLSIAFAVAMTGAFGILLFSSTVTNVLIVTGSTYTIALTLYIVTVVGLVIFAVYANNVYMKYKMDEIGVFLSLGLKISDVHRLMNREFYCLYGLSAAVGLLLALPVSFLSWSFLTLFLTTAETAFTAGLTGYGIAITYIGIAACILLYRNNRTIQHIDIIQILRVTAANETVKGASFLPGLIGLLCIPVGIAVFWVLNSISTLAVSYSSYSGAGLMMSAVGLYLFTAYITSIGDFFRRYKRDWYLKNLLFFNLMKQKGKQYTLSLFISTLLIAIAIFGISFNSTAFIAGYYDITNDIFDYAILIPDAWSGNLNGSVLYDLAAESDMEIEDMNELKFLHIGRQHLYGEGNAEWSEEYCVSVSDFNALADTDLVIESGNFICFSDMEETPIVQTLARQNNNLYLPDNKEFIKMDLQDIILAGTIVNSSCTLTDFIILNDQDYEEMSRKLKSRFKYCYYLWNVKDSQNEEQFFNRLLRIAADESGGRYMVNLNTMPVRELMAGDGKDVPLEDIYISYKGNELDAARNWEFYPFSRATASAALRETGAVYLLLMFFIAVIGFVSATMIIGLRVVNTIWQDEATYKKVEYLGGRPRALKRLVTQQMAMIFFFPAIAGSLISILIINRMISVTAASQHSVLVTLVAVILSLTAIVVEICVFFALRRKVCADVRTSESRSFTVCS